MSTVEKDAKSDSLRSNQNAQPASGALKLMGSLLLMLAFALVFAGVFLPWVSDQPSAFSYEGYEVEYYGPILIVLLVGLASGVVIQERRVSIIIGGLTLAVTVVAAVFWQGVLGWACFRAYGIATVMCSFQGYGLGFVSAMAGAILTLAFGLAFWHLERPRIRSLLAIGMVA
jgi:hypothetical protein